MKKPVKLVPANNFETWVGEGRKEARKEGRKGGREGLWGAPSEPQRGLGLALLPHL